MNEGQRVKCLEDNKYYFIAQTVKEGELFFNETPKAMVYEDKEFSNYEAPTITFMLKALNTLTPAQCKYNKNKVCNNTHDNNGFNCKLCALK